MSTTLIVGADGLIGRSLLSRPAAPGEARIGTTRRRESVAEARVYLDLGAGPGEWRFDLPIDVAVICAAANGFEACRRDPDATRAANVDGVLALAEKLIRRGSHVVYLSTHAVFDGSVASCPADHPHSPRGEYGRQKSEAEGRLSRFGAAVSVVRLTKVFGPFPPLFRKWMTAIRSGDPIQPVYDFVIAPVGLSFVVEVLEHVIRRRPPGVVQVSATAEMSYSDAAFQIANRIGAHVDLIRPISAHEAGVPPEAITRHATLDTTRLRDEFGFTPPVPSLTIDEAMGLRPGPMAPSRPDTY